MSKPRVSFRQLGGRGFAAIGIVRVEWPGGSWSEYAHDRFGRPVNLGRYAANYRHWQRWINRDLKRHAIRRVSAEEVRREAARKDPGEFNPEQWIASAAAISGKPESEIRSALH